MVAPHITASSSDPESVKSAGTCRQIHLFTSFTSSCSVCFGEDHVKTFVFVVETAGERSSSPSLTYCKHLAATLFSKQETMTMTMKVGGVKAARLELQRLWL